METVIGYVCHDIKLVARGMLAEDTYVEMLCKCRSDLTWTILFRAVPGMTLDVADREKIVWT